MFFVIVWKPHTDKIKRIIDEDRLLKNKKKHVSRREDAPAFLTKYQIKKITRIVIINQ